VLSPHSRERDRMVHSTCFGRLATLLASKFFAQGASGSDLINTSAPSRPGSDRRLAHSCSPCGRPGGPQVHVPHHAQRHGPGDGPFGFVPSYAQIGALAGVLLLYCAWSRAMPGAASMAARSTYVAEHAPDEKRGYYTGWLRHRRRSGSCLARGNRHNAGVARGGGVRCVGLADSFLLLARHGRGSRLHPLEAPGDPDLSRPSRRKGRRTPIWREAFLGPICSTS